MISFKNEKMISFKKKKQFPCEKGNVFTFLLLVRINTWKMSLNSTSIWIAVYKIFDTL